MSEIPGYLELYDYRVRVAAHYRERNNLLAGGEDPSAVSDRFRAARDDLFRLHAHSAIPEDGRPRFTGLSYYPYDPAACVDALVDTDVEPVRLEMGTSGEESMPMSRVANLHFRLAGQSVTLSMYWIDVYGGGLFLPFRDGTAPRETYGGGRYLFDTVKGSDFLTFPGERGNLGIVLDFNYAYNPSCSYDYRWVCPLAPPENRLDCRIEAGEKIYRAPDDAV